MSVCPSLSLCVCVISCVVVVYVCLCVNGVSAHLCLFVSVCMSECVCVCICMNAAQGEECGSWLKSGFMKEPGGLTLGKPKIRFSSQGPRARWGSGGDPGFSVLSHPHCCPFVILEMGHFADFVWVLDLGSGGLVEKICNLMLEAMNSPTPTPV